MKHWNKIFLILVFWATGCENQDLKKGKSFLELEDYTKAAESFETAIKTEPENAEAHFLLGETYENLDQREKALEEYNYSIKLDLKDASNIFSNKAQQFIEQNPRWAEKIFELAIKADTTNADANYGLGEIYRTQGNLRNAFGYLIKALKFSKTNRFIQPIFESLKYISEPYTISLGNRSHIDFGPVTFTPDGKNIVFSRAPYRDGYRPVEIQVYIIKIDTQEITKFGHLWAWGAFPGFSSMDELIYQSGSWSINEFNLTTKKFRNLVKGSQPSISNDGEKLAFVRDEDVYMSNIDGSNVIRITENDVPDFVPQITPSGDKLFFMSFRNNQVSLYEIDTKTRVENKIRDVEGSYDRRSPEVFIFDIAPEGNKIVYTNDNNNLSLMDLDTKEEAFITRGYQPSFSRDGRRIAFLTAHRPKQLSLIEVDKMNQYHSFVNGNIPDREKLIDFLENVTVQLSKKSI